MCDLHSDSLKLLSPSADSRQQHANHASPLLQNIGVYMPGDASNRRMYKTGPAKQSNSQHQTNVVVCLASYICLLGMLMHMNLDACYHG